MQTLGLPVDITWQRLGYSRDLIDTSFGDLTLPPKWRSSLAVYSYVVPEEHTLDSYPDSRIVYFKLSCSITGFNIGEELIDPSTVAESGDQLDDLQTSTWEAIQSQGWANRYWPCRGAIVQFAVYPGEEDDVGPDDFPFIQDFEPKKRELFETRSESGEFLSGSSENLNIQKGTTTTESVEKSDILTGMSVEAKGFGFGGGASVSGEWGTRKSQGTSSVNTTTTDASREKRESTSFSTNFSQMYQLFNGYHLGTNRAVFVITPRPHTVSEPAQVDFNLVNGQRKLEGVQEIFLVVRAPRSLKGVSVQANLDTGHIVERFNGVILRLAIDDEPGPGGGGGGPPDVPDDDFPPIHQPLDPSSELANPYSTRLLVTRRVIRNRGVFSEDDRIIPQAVPAPEAGETRNLIVHEEAIDYGVSDAVLAATAESATGAKRRVADQRNRYQRRITNSMLSGFSAGKYTPRPVVHTKAFADLARMALSEADITIDEKLVKQGVITREELKTLSSVELTHTQNLFALGDRRLTAAQTKQVLAIRKKIQTHALKL